MRCSCFEFYGLGITQATTVSMPRSRAQGTASGPAHHPDLPPVGGGAPAVSPRPNRPLNSSARHGRERGPKPRWSSCGSVTNTMSSMVRAMRPSRRAWSTSGMARGRELRWQFSCSAHPSSDWMEKRARAQAMLHQCDTFRSSAIRLDGETGRRIRWYAHPGVAFSRPGGYVSCGDRI